MGRTNSQLSGGGDKGLENLKFSATEFQFSNSAEIPADCEITLPYLQTRVFDLVSSNPPITNLTVNALGTITNMSRFLRRGNQIKTVTITFDTSQATSIDLYMSANVEAIYGTIDATSATGAIGMVVGNQYKLTYLRFAPDTISCNITLHACKVLTMDSWNSVFAGLKTITEAHTITLPGQVTFTQEQLDGITAKGWTIARYN